MDHENGLLLRLMGILVVLKSHPHCSSPSMSLLFCNCLAASILSGLTIKNSLRIFIYNFLKSSMSCAFQGR